jgi:hypothetical protein
MATFRGYLMTGLLGLLVAVLLCAATFAQNKEPPKDFKDFDLKELGIELVSPQKDAKTGFLVGGKNATALVQGLTEINGRTVAELEKDMRPGARTEDFEGSDKGFLGPEEKLLDVLAADNQFVVDELGLTHQELARHLRVLAAIGDWQVMRKKPSTEFLYHGRRMTVQRLYFKGYQLSPFRDGTKTSTDATIHNLSNGKTLAYSLLVPDMIERYGFYEGKGTPYRVEPRSIVEVLDFLKVKPIGR